MKDIHRHCEQSEAIQTRRAIFTIAWIAALTLAMTVTDTQAADKKNTVKKSYATALQKLDTTNLSTFDCAHITSPVQEAVCRGGLIQSNIDLVKDVNELTLATGPQGQSFVTKSQALWRQSRNADCEMENFGKQGTMATTNFIFCVTAHNQNRHRYFQQLFNRGALK